MNNNLTFVTLRSGLEVSFRVISKVPAKSIFDWDFGDDKGEVSMVEDMFPILMKLPVSIQ